jgi:hypothetical protein
MKNLRSQKLVSSAFADGMLEDMATNRKIIPDDVRFTSLPLQASRNFRKVHACTSGIVRSEHASLSHQVAVIRPISKYMLGSCFCRRGESPPRFDNSIVQREIHLI